MYFRFPREFGLWGRNEPYGSHLHASRTHLDLHDRGLHGASGATHIISLLEAHPTYQHLVLGNNPLSDDGVVILFEYLRSHRGRKLAITDISLNSCHIGNLGLQAICRYLNGNRTLEDLYLQNNEFFPSWALTSHFTSAINNSNLVFLSLTSNSQLSDTFLFRFLPNLSTRSLKSLHLSATGITPVSTPYITKFLATDGPEKPQPTKSAVELLKVLGPKEPTRLRDLRLNGNSLSLECVAQIVATLRTKNFDMQHLELHANAFDPFAPTPPADPNAEETPLIWGTLKDDLSIIFTRNLVLSKRAGRNAVQTLGPARVLLLPPRKDPTSTPWRKLPVELQLYILSFLGPGLSPQQRIRIWQYASDWDSLPPQQRVTPLWYTKEPSTKTPTQHREEWLRKVGCDHFEWYEGWEADFASLLQGAT